MISCCAAARMLMTGVVLPGGATVRAAATDDCRLDAMLTHELDTLRVRPGRRSSEIIASRQFLPLVGCFCPAADVVACWPSELYSQWVPGSDIKCPISRRRWMSDLRLRRPPEHKRIKKRQITIPTLQIHWWYWTKKLMLSTRVWLVLLDNMTSQWKSLIDASSLLQSVGAPAEFGRTRQRRRWNPLHRFKISSRRVWALPLSLGAPARSRKNLLS